MRSRFLAAFRFLLFGIRSADAVVTGPMNQHDKLVSPMFDAFTDTPDPTPYTFIPNQIPLETGGRRTS